MKLSHSLLGKAGILRYRVFDGKTSGGLRILLRSTVRSMGIKTMEPDPTLVQFGCGRSCPSQWLNYDSSPRLWLERAPIVGWALRQAKMAVFPDNAKVGDIITGLPHKPMSVDAVFCSHVLEHLDRESVQIALKNTYGMLKLGGVFRLVVPDLAWRVDEYMFLKKTDPEKAADSFLTKTMLGRVATPRGVIERARVIFGNSAHLWMYDYALMAALLKSAGFHQIRRCSFGDSQIYAFGEVEELGRFQDDGNKELAIEAIKPRYGLKHTPPD